MPTGKDSKYRKSSKFNKVKGTEGKAGGRAHKMRVTKTPKKEML